MTSCKEVSSRVRRTWGLAICGALLMTPVASAAIRLNVSASPNPARVGETLDVALTVTNDDAFLRSGVSVTLDIPASLNALPISLLGPQFDSTSCRQISGDNRCTSGERAQFLLGDLAPGEGTTISIPPQVAPTTPDGTTIAFDVEVFDDSVLQVTGTASVVVNATRELDIELVANRNPVPSGELLTYTMAYGVLAGNPSIASPRLSMSIPSGTTFVSATDGGLPNAGVVEWSFSSFLSGGASGEVQMTVQVNPGTPSASILVTQAVFENLAGSMERVETTMATHVQDDDALELVIVTSPDPVRQGDTMDLELTITNDTGLPRTGIVVTVAFPRGLDSLPVSLLGSRFDTTSCRQISGDNRCTSRERARFLLGDLAPGEGTTISIPPVVAGITPNGSAIQFNAAVTDDTGNTRRTGSTLTVLASRELQLVVVADRNPVPSGELLTYTMAYGVLAGNPSIASPRLSMSIPSGTTFVSATDGGSPSLGVVEWPFSTFLSGGASGEIQMTVQVNPGTPSASILVTHAVFENLAGSLERVEYALATPVQDDDALELVMVASPDPVRQGEVMDLELTITNDTGLPRTGIVVTVAFPRGLDSLPVSLLGSRFDATSCRQISGDNRCTSRERARFLLGDLAPGEGTTISIPPVVSGSTANGAAIRFDAALMDDSGNTRRTGVTFTVLGTRELQLVVAADRSPVPTGELLTYTMAYGVVQNGDTVSNGILSMPVPKGTCFVAASDGGTLNNGRVEWTVGAVSAGSGGERLLEVRVSAEEGRIVNAVAHFQDGTDVSTRSRSETSTRVESLTPLTLDLLAGPSPAISGDILEIVMSVTNTSSLPRSGIVVGLEFPGGLDSLPASELGPLFDTSSCRQISGDNRCTSKERALFLIGNLAPGETVIVVVQPTVAVGTPNGALIRFDAFVTDNAGFQTSHTDVVKVGTLFDPATAIPPFADCNENGNPDACDIADGLSLDVDPADGVPDECVVWTAGGGSSLWSDPSNWDILVVPNNNAGGIFVPTISGGANSVTLDIDVAIDTLRVLDSAQLSVTAGSLTLEQLGMINEGLVMIGGGREIVADADVTFSGIGTLRLAGVDANLRGGTGVEVVSNRSVIAGTGLIGVSLNNQVGEGIVRADVSGEVLQLMDGIKQNDGMFEAVGDGTLTIADTTVNGLGFYVADGGTIAIRPGSNGPGSATVSGQFMEITNGGTFDINATASMSLTGNLVVDSCRTSASTMTVPASLEKIRSDGAVAGGCTPPRKPKLSVSNTASVTIEGSLALLTDVEVFVTVPFSDVDGAGVTLAGDFENTSTTPLSFDWSAGSMSLSGTTGQTFEVAGEDFGAVPCGMESNFAMGTLEVQAGAVVDLVNSVNNMTGGAGVTCEEALYVDTLILRAGSVLRPTGGSLYYRRLIGAGVVDDSLACGSVVKMHVEDRDCDEDVDLRDVASFMPCFGVTESDAKWATCKWANLAEVNVVGVDEAIDLDDYALFFLTP